MGIQIRKRPDGKLEARKSGNENVFLVGQGFREQYGILTTIKHYIDPGTRSVYYAITNLVMSMLYDADDSEEGEFKGGWDDDDDRVCGEPAAVNYPGTVFLYFDSYSDGQQCYLIDRSGKILSGSNTFGGGNLCLGDHGDPLTMQPVDPLMFNEANTDLKWFHEPLRGSWIESGGNPDIFRIETWPSTSTLTNIPQCILDDNQP